MIYEVSHKTTYRYSQKVSISHHVLHLTPRDGGDQTTHSSRIDVAPTPSLLSATDDYFGNAATFLTLQESHRVLTIEARSVVEVASRVPPVPERSVAWERGAAEIADDRRPVGLDVLQYVFDSSHTVATPEITAYARESFTPGRPLLAAARDLTHRIYKDFAYSPKATEISTPISTVFAQRLGVCQDFAHLEIGCLRSLGLAARYVSGYLLTRAPEGKERLVGADASHAWLALFVPGIGWVDLDPTNDLIPGDEHITIAWGRDYTDVSPVNGVIFGGGKHRIDVAVDVRPLAHGAAYFAA